MIGRPNAGEHQQLRRIDRATTKDRLFVYFYLFFFALLYDCHTRDASVLKEQPAYLSAGAHSEVGSVHNRGQECSGGAMAFAVLLSYLIESYPILLRSIEITVFRKSY